MIQADSLPIIEVDFEQSEADFEKQLLAELGVDSICAGSPSIGFSLEYPTKNIFKSSKKLIFGRLFIMIVEIRMN
ncbi:MAG: hypothetical protein HC803_03510 [Saprospiraceae bacterium]|nr:hypothetical protein [Saprospiraceae bacterium]